METEGQNSKKKKILNVFGFLTSSAILQGAEKCVFNCLTLVQKLRRRVHTDSEAQAGSALLHLYKPAIPSNEINSTEQMKASLSLAISNLSCHR